MRRAVLALAVAVGLAPHGAGAQGGASTTTGVLRGVVIDSTTMQPLPGALVQLALRSDVTRGVPQMTQTDSAGAFLLDSIPPGDYIATFFHARLETLGLVGPLRAVTVGAGAGNATVTLAVPSGARLVAQLCGRPASDDSNGAVLGVVRSAHGGATLPGATVTVRWFEMFIRSKQLHAARREVVTLAGADGQFAACDVPANLALEVQATVGRARTGRVDLVVAPRSVAAQELTIDLSDTVATGGAGDRRGTAFVYGVVRSPAGAPLPGARIEVVGSGVTSVSNEKGIYALGNVPAGTQMLEARAIGFVPVMRPVNLSPIEGVTADIHFDSAAVMLEAVDVVAEARFARQIAAFDEARRTGFGAYLDQDAIADRGASRTTDLLKMVAGVHVVRSGELGGGNDVYLRGGMLNRCKPAFFVDGVRFEGVFVDIDAMVDPLELVGVAVYRGLSETPAEFMGGSSCGSIVVWTKRGAPLKFKKLAPKAPADSAVADSAGVRR